MGKTITLRARGLYTDPNSLSAAPEGALARARNVVISREGIIEPRRGFEPYDDGGVVAFTSGTGTQEYTAGNRPERIFAFKEHLISLGINNSMRYHLGDGMLYDTANDLRRDGMDARWKVMKTEAGKNAYFTSRLGVRRLAEMPNGTRPAGILRAPDIGRVTFNTTLNSWLPTNSQVAYRIIYGYKDANGVIYLGAPSGRVLVNNTTGGNRDPSFEIYSPLYLVDDGIEGYFVQVYRTAVFTAPTGVALGDSCGDEMGLVAEITWDVLGAVYTYTYNDLATDVMRGASLYTNPSQAGILSSNDTPPYCLDLTNFKNHTFFANTKSKHVFQLQFMGIKDPALATRGLIIGDKISFNGVTMEAVAPASEFVSNRNFAISTNTDPAIRLRETAQSFCHKFNRIHGSFLPSDQIERFLAFYTSSPDGIPGQITFVGIQVGLNEKSLSGGHLGVSRNDTTSLFEPRPPLTVVSNVGGITQAVGSNVVTVVTTTNHGLVVGDEVSISSDDASLYRLDTQVDIDVRATYRVTQVNSVTSFDVDGDSTVHAGGVSTIAARVHKANVGASSSADAYPGRLHHSRYGLFEAAPLVSYFDVGATVSDILRVTPLGDSLFIWKTDGLFRLTGDDATSFRVSEFDPTVILKCVDSVAAVGNQLYAMTNQGIVAVSETGVEIVSSPIDNLLVDAENEAGDSFRNDSFGIGYESESKYIFCAVTQEGSHATTAFVLNIGRGWTTWDINARHGCYDPQEDKLMLCSGQDTYLILVEKKRHRPDDHSDEDAWIRLASSSGTSMTFNWSVYLAAIKAGDIIKDESASLMVVESVDVISRVIVVDENLSVGGNHRVHRQVDMDVQWKANVADEPGGLKHFREVTLLIDRPSFDHAQITFDSDLAPGEIRVTVNGWVGLAWGDGLWGDGPWGGEAGGRVVRTLVPRNVARSSELLVGVKLPRAGECLSIRGLVVYLSGGGDERVPR